MGQNAASRRKREDRRRDKLTQMRSMLRGAPDDPIEDAGTMQMTQAMSPGN